MLKSLPGSGKRVMAASCLRAVRRASSLKSLRVLMSASVSMVIVILFVEQIGLIYIINRGVPETAELSPSDVRKVCQKKKSRKHHLLSRCEMSFRQWGYSVLTRVCDKCTILSVQPIRCCNGVGMPTDYHEIGKLQVTA